MSLVNSHGGEKECMSLVNSHGGEKECMSLVNSHGGEKECMSLVNSHGGEKECMSLVNSHGGEKECMSLVNSHGGEKRVHEPCRTGIHAARDWRLSSKFKLFMSVLSVSVVGGSVVLHKTNTNKRNSTQ